jgi:hypothetical protein
LESWIDRTLRDVARLRPDRLLKRRQERLRNLGGFFTHTGEAAKPKTTRTRTRRKTPAPPAPAAAPQA